MYRWTYDKLVFPAWHAILRDGANAAVRTMAKRDAATADQLRQVERRKLTDLLTTVHRDVPYYRDLLCEAGVMSDGQCDLSAFAALPLLTKDIIRENADALVSRNTDDNPLVKNSTSGSSGSPLHFQTDLRSRSARKGAVQRNRQWIAIRRGDPVVHVWGSPIDASRASGWRGRLHGVITRELFLSAYHLTESDMAGYAQKIEAFRPALLVGYPSILQSFASYCMAHGIAFPSLRAVICSAETLYDEQREVIESAWHAPVFNRYGCREVGDVAQQRPGLEGLVVNSDRTLVEILDEHGQPCPPGITGEIVVTDLDNVGMPMIRYRIGDRGAWSVAEGRTTDCPWPVLDRVEGRVLDVVTTPDGNQIGGTFWTILFRQRPGIDIFQVLQERQDGVRIRYVPDATETAIDRDYFVGQIRKLGGPDFHVEFEPVSKIGPDETGKFRIVKSLLKSSAARGSGNETQT